jgi:hypothetical protein
MSTSFPAIAGLLSALAVARTSQTVPPAEPAPCAALPAPASRDADHLFDDMAPSRLDWYDALSTCTRSTRAAAKTSLARRADGKATPGGRVTVRGHLATGSVPTHPVDVLDEDDKSSKCQPSQWRWELVLCGGERIEIQFREKHDPSHFIASTCGQPLLTSPSRQVVVSGRLAEKDGIGGVHPAIENAKICRP